MDQICNIKTYSLNLEILFFCVRKRNRETIIIVILKEIVESFYGFFERVSYYYVKLRDECCFKLTFITRNNSRKPPSHKLHLKKTNIRTFNRFDIKTNKPA